MSKADPSKTQSEPEVAADLLSTGEDAAALARLALVGTEGDLSEALAKAPVMTGLPFAGALGVRMISSGAGEALLAIPYDPALIGDPETGVIHGGVVTSLLDTCGGVAVLASPTRPLSVATLDLRIDYMRPARPGETVYAHARCYRETREITFVSAAAYHADRREAPIAAAVGAFMVEGRRGAIAEDVEVADGAGAPGGEA